MDKCGTYTLNFILEDANWNVDRDKVYYISVVDETPPEIAVQGSYKEAYALGTTVKVLKTVATDAISAGEKLRTYVLVFTPKYETILLMPEDSKRNSFTVEQEGTYRIMHYAVDEAGNHSILTYEIRAY